MSCQAVVALSDLSQKEMKICLVRAEVEQLEYSISRTQCQDRVHVLCPANFVLQDFVGSYS